MRSILIVAAGLLQLTYGAVLPNLGGAEDLQPRHQGLAARARKTPLVVGTPVLDHGPTFEPVKEGDVFDFVGPKPGSDFKRNVPALTYKLSEIADSVLVALVKPAGSSKTSSGKTVTVKSANGASSVHEIVGTFTNNKNDELLEEEGEHGLLLSRLQETKQPLPDGKFHIAMVATSGVPGEEPTTFLSPQFEVKKQGDVNGGADKTKKTAGGKPKKPEEDIDIR